MDVNFIAEVSSNHSKDLDRALKFVDESSFMNDYRFNSKVKIIVF